jgi:CHAT domain-containing protein
VRVANAAPDARTTSASSRLGRSIARGRTGDDGILTAAEVVTLDLRGVEIVVLSACETGLGQSAGGEGVLGLQRAFQVAGARTVVASLWEVPDEATRALMTRAYENWWSGKQSKLEGLIEAQRRMLKEGVPGPDGKPGRGRTPPYYWAAFVLSGDWR